MGRHSRSTGQTSFTGTPASLSLCVAVDDAGNALVSTAPSQNQWQTTSVNQGSPLYGVSCPSTALCVAAGDNGRVVALPEPATNLALNAGTYDSGHALLAISCTSSLCVAVDDAGHAISSTNFGAALPAWTLSTADSGHALASISCAPAGMCVAGDDDGAAVAGAVPAPVVGTSAPRSVSSTAADLTGTVMPNAATVSDCHFSYGTSLAYGHTVACTTTPSGSSQVSVLAHVTGLTPNAPLHVRLVAGDAGGTSAGSDVQSRTLPLAPTIGPRTATQTQPTTTLLSAWVNPNGGRAHRVPLRLRPDHRVRKVGARARRASAHHRQPSSSLQASPT